MRNGFEYPAPVSPPRMPLMSLVLSQERMWSPRGISSSEDGGGNDASVWGGPRAGNT